ncbi:Brefeldin A-inhibited guanine nucleotide-exchange protein [Forsythia ovata]|uniref:Brefeldin A-inhibited guanine nucleotide-exchange protein n=1 Tax=Forsythia ovata TaxID=205694 RepID=A0ABD1TU25_9LAMI
MEKIIKNASWRKHSKLATEFKSVIEQLTIPNQNNSSSPNTRSDSNSSPSHPGAFLYLSLFDSDLILSHFINSISSNHNKASKLAFDDVHKLIAYGYLHGKADLTGGTYAQLLSKVIESVCKCHDLGEENVELLMIKTLLLTVTSVTLQIHRMVVVVDFRFWGFIKKMITLIKYTIFPTIKYYARKVNFTIKKEFAFSKGVKEWKSKLKKSHLKFAVKEHTLAMNYVTSVK